MRGREKEGKEVGSVRRKEKGQGVGLEKENARSKRRISKVLCAKGRK